MTKLDVISLAAKLLEAIPDKSAGRIDLVDWHRNKFLALPECRDADLRELRVVIHNAAWTDEAKQALKQVWDEYA